MPKPIKPPKPDKKPHGKPDKSQQHHGQLMALTFAPDILTLRERGRNVALPVAATVLVVIDRTKAELADLMAGMNVFANADASGVVVSIDARSDKDDPDDPVPVPPVPAA